MADAYTPVFLQLCDVVCCTSSVWSADPLHHLMQEGVTARGWTTSSTPACTGKRISPGAGYHGRSCDLVGIPCFGR